MFVENHEPFSRIVTKSLLSEHAVTVVPSIAAAQHILANALFDLVLIDYDLDDGKGTELVRHVKDLPNRPLVLATSSHARGNDALRNAGADGACSKLDFADIGIAIADLLSRG